MIDTWGRVRGDAAQLTGMLQVTADVSEAVLAYFGGLQVLVAAFLMPVNFPSGQQPPAAESVTTACRAHGHCTPQAASDHDTTSRLP